MPRKPGPGRTEYNNAWNARNPEAAAEHRKDANIKFRGAPESEKRKAYNTIQARNRREARARKKKAAATAARLLALAAERARGAGTGYAGAVKPKHF